MSINKHLVISVHFSIRTKVNKVGKSSMWDCVELVINAVTLLACCISQKLSSSLLSAYLGGNTEQKQSRSPIQECRFQLFQDPVQIKYYLGNTSGDVAVSQG